MNRCEHAETLTKLFQERVKASSTQSAYCYYDETQTRWVSLDWKTMGVKVAQCAAALKNEGLEKGARVGIMLPNGYDWVTVEQASLFCGLVVVPLYFNDRVDNVRYIIQNSGMQCLFIHHSMQEIMVANKDLLAELECLVIIGKDDIKPVPNGQIYSQWVAKFKNEALPESQALPNDMSSIVYTSGTSGLPKGVMLSHRNILWNAQVCKAASVFTENDRFLSLLPLSHMLERTAGYYLPMLMGADVAFARSPLTYADDLRATHPSILVVVPRVLERIQEKVQHGLESASFIKRWLFSHCMDEGWQGFLQKANKREYGFLSKIIVKKFSERLGGRVRLVICGGAPLNEQVSKMFIGLGLDIVQGYGLTETSPVVCVNRLEANRPDTVGLPLDDVEVRISEQQELQTRSPGIMLGYWGNDELTHAVLDQDGWLKTGDQAVIEDGFVRITGRLKDIIVLSTGEKISPTDIEMKLVADPYIDQALVLGNGYSALTAIIVIDSEHSLAEQNFGDKKAEEAFMMKRISACLQSFPGYVKIARVIIADEPWTQENACLTPTLKIKRSVVEEKYFPNGIS